MELWGGGLTREPIGERRCGRVRGREPPPLGLVFEDFLFVELASGTWPDTGREAVRDAGRKPRDSAGRGPARHSVPTTGPCGMLYCRSTAASSASDRTA